MQLCFMEHLIKGTSIFLLSSDFICVAFSFVPLMFYMCFLFYLGAVPFQSLYIWQFYMDNRRGGRPPGLNSFEKQYLSFLHFIQKNFPSLLLACHGTTPFEDEFIINQEPRNPYLLFVCSDLTILVILPDLCNCTFSAYFPQNESLPKNHLV